MDDSPVDQKSQRAASAAGSDQNSDALPQTPQLPDGASDPRTPQNKYDLPDFEWAVKKEYQQEGSPTRLGYQGRDDLTQPDPTPLEDRKPPSRTPFKQRGYLPGTQGRYKLMDQGNKQTSKGAGSPEEGAVGDSPPFGVPGLGFAGPGDAGAGGAGAGVSAALNFGGDDPSSDGLFSGPSRSGVRGLFSHLEDEGDDADDDGGGRFQGSPMTGRESRYSFTTARSEPFSPVGPEAAFPREGQTLPGQETAVGLGDASGAALPSQEPTEANHPAAQTFGRSADNASQGTHSSPRTVEGPGYGSPPQAAAGQDVAPLFVGGGSNLNPDEKPEKPEKRGWGRAGSVSSWGSDMVHGLRQAKSAAAGILGLGAPREVSASEEQEDDGPLTQKRLVARLQKLLGYEFAAHQLKELQKDDLTTLGDGYIKEAEAWLAEHALRDELLEGGLLEGRYNLTAGWRINNSIEASSLILRLRLAAQQGFDSTSPEQMAERDRECQDALMGYLERQLGRLQQTRDLVEDEKRFEQQLGHKYLYEGAPNPVEDEALELENKALKKKLLLFQTYTAKLQRGDTTRKAPAILNEGSEEFREFEREMQLADKAKAALTRRVHEELKLVDGSTVSPGTDPWEVYRRIEPFVKGSGELDRLLRERTARIAQQGLGTMDPAEGPTIKTFLSFLAKMNDITRRFLAGDHLDVLGEFDPVKEADQLLGEEADDWEKLKLPRSALGRLALLKAKMLMRIEGPASERTQAALAVAMSYELDKDPDTPAVFGRIVDDMRQSVANSTRGDAGELALSCGCTYDVWKCSDHSAAVGCPCEHHGTIVLCGDHHKDFESRYSIGVLPNRFGKQLGGPNPVF